MPQVNITVEINDSIYIKDPLGTDLGQRIIRNAIILLDEIGFEELTFKKLAKKIESAEASIYRYFENKYKLLTYLVSWYWDFMHYMILMDIRNMKDPKEKLTSAIRTLVNSLDSTLTPDYIDETRLHRLVVENASKVYHTKQVDSLNTEGYYVNYKKLIKTLAMLIQDLSPDFKFPVAFATSIVEQSLNNEYYLEHLPGLTDALNSDEDARESTIKMIMYLIERAL